MRPHRPQLAYRPSARRRPSRPCSGRTFAVGSSHLGPPTAPSSTASARWHACSVSSGSAEPVASMAAPPMRCASNASGRPSCSRDRLQHDARRAHHLGPDAVAGQQYDLRCFFFHVHEATAAVAVERACTAYSMLSASACHDASTMLDEAPSVDQRALAVGGVDEHARDRRRALAPVDDAHLVVARAASPRSAGTKARARAARRRRARAPGRSRSPRCAACARRRRS